MVESILSEPLAQTAFVFILVFTLVFGILQKSKLLGDGKKQIDALVALAIGLIVTSVGYALDIIQRLVPFLAVALVILFVFLLLFAFVHIDKYETPKGLKIALGIIIGIAVIIAVLVITGGGQFILDWFRGNDSGFLGNIIILAVVVGAVAIALSMGKSSSGSSGSGK